MLLLARSLVALISLVAHAAVAEPNPTHVCVNVERANVRAGPGKEHRAIAVLQGGSNDFYGNDIPPEPLKVVVVESAWLDVLLANGTRGWISASVVREAVRVTAERAVVYAVPNAVPAETLTKGDVFCAQRPLGTWHRIGRLKANEEGRTTEIPYFIDSRLTNRPVRSAYGGSFLSAILNCDLPALEANLPGVDFDQESGFWRGTDHSSLYWALEVGCFDAADRLVKAGHDPVKGGYGANLIFHWSDSPSAVHVRWLIAKGVDVNGRNNWYEYFKEAPLHYAIRSGSLEIIQLLVDAGAKIDARDAHCYTAYDYVVAENRRPEVAAYFESVAAERGIVLDRPVEAARKRGLFELAEILETVPRATPYARGGKKAEQKC